MFPPLSKRTRLPPKRTYLGYTLTPRYVGIVWDVRGKFTLSEDSRIASVEIGGFHTLKEAKEQARRYKAEFGRAKGT